LAWLMATLATLRNTSVPPFTQLQTENQKTSKTMNDNDSISELGQQFHSLHDDYAKMPYSSSIREELATGRVEPLTLADESGNSGNVVTTSTATTTSSLDDHDSSLGSEVAGIVGGTLEQGGSDPVRHHHHRHHRSRRRVMANDGSALLVPEGNAARLPRPDSDTTTNVSSIGSGGEGETAKKILLQPHREPAYNTSPRTFSKLPRRTRKIPSSPNEESSTPQGKASAHARRRDSPSPYSGGDDGSSSGSGTEGGYAASASSNSNSGLQEYLSKKSSRAGRGGSVDSCSSSEIADFSSGASGLSFDSFSSTPSPSPSLSSSNEEGLDDLEQTYLKAKNAVVQNDARILKTTARKAADERTWSRNRSPIKWPRQIIGISENSKIKASCDKGVRPPILTLGSDIMANVLTFLQPPEILEVLAEPLSKGWRQTFTLQPELWRVLCIVEPFKAKLAEDVDSDAGSDNSFVSLKFEQKRVDKKLLDKYRLLYNSFVRCMKYLSQIQEDAVNGRQPSVIDYGFASRGTSRDSGPPKVVGANKNLQAFLARARGVVEDANSDSNASYQNDDVDTQLVQNTLQTQTVKPGKRKRITKSKEKKRKFGRSILTHRLLGPSQSGEPGNLSLPWSCAIYSIVNWMVAFLDVEGIQILCMKVLPFLLEDEEQRLTAQRSGLTDVVLRGMVLFNNSVQLHIAAFHAIVLLARPVGGSEGMLFHSSMVASGIFGGQHSQHRKNGIAVMLDSMRRFEDNEVLQAMSCWALVNIALAPAQKAVLVKLGGIQATANAMLSHPFNAEVQFRALFALINLVIPSVRMNSDSPEALAIQEQLGEVNDTTEKQIIDELAGEISDLVVRAMKNFCSSEAILNRACLVLHNLSLTQEYHTILLWTPNCYQMLEWCLANYRTDQVLQQSASGTIHRLQVTLSNDSDLRHRFTESLHSQQQKSLEQAHREAMRLHAQKDELLRT
jgi:hypothetical protein